MRGWHCPGRASSIHLVVVCVGVVHWQHMYCLLILCAPHLSLLVQVLALKIDWIGFPIMFKGGGGRGCCRS